MKLKLLSLVFLALSLSGCAGMAVQQELGKMQSFFNPLMGTEAKETILQTIGAPHSTFQSGDTEIWEYHFSYGSRQATTGFQGNQPGVINSGFAMTGSRESFDKITCYFDDNGVLMNWKSYVQR